LTAFSNALLIPAKGMCTSRLETRDPLMSPPILEPKEMEKFLRIMQQTAVSRRRQ